MMSFIKTLARTINYRAPRHLPNPASGVARELLRHFYVYGNLSGSDLTDVDALRDAYLNETSDIDTLLADLIVKGDALVISKGAPFSWFYGSLRLSASLRAGTPGTPGTPGTTAVTFGALDLDTFSGLPKPSGAASITDAGGTNLVLSGSDVVPDTGGGVSSGTVIFNDSTTWDVTALASTYVVSTVGEVEDITDGTNAIGTGKTVALRPGTYDLDSITFSSQPTDVIWKSVDNGDRAIITKWSLHNATGSGTFTLKEIDIEYNLPLTAEQFWSPAGITTWAIINADGAPMSAITLDDVSCNGGMLPWLEGGRMSHNNAFIFARPSVAQTITVKNCEIYNVMTGICLDGVDGFTIEDNEFYNFHADPIDLQNSRGDCQNGIIRNNHSHHPSGTPSNFHADFIQFQPSSASGNSFSDIEIYGNTVTYGEQTPVSQVDPSGAKTFNVYSTSFLIPTTEHAQETRLDPSGAMTVTMPSAVGNRGEQYCLRYLSTGTGTATIALDGTDTADAPPTLTAAGQYATFVSDGAGHWDALSAGFRTWFLLRDYNFTGGDLEDGWVSSIDASQGAVTMTLPATGARSFHIQRIDNVTANAVTITATADTITLNGSTSGSVTMTPGYGLNITRTDDGNWTATEGPLTHAFLFSNPNAGNWENISVYGNIMNIPGAAMRIEDEVTNFSVYNNTTMPFIIQDQNADGVIGIYEGNQTSQLSELSGSGIVQANTTFGTISLGADGAAPTAVLNDVNTVSDSDPIPTVVTDRLVPTTRAGYETTTRQDVVNMAVAKAGGPWDGAFLGAVGKDASGSFYDFVNNEVNASATIPLPTISTLSPEDNTDTGPDAVLTATFNQYIEVGTGNVVLRNVTANSVIETFNIATGIGDG